MTFQKNLAAYGFITILSTLGCANGPHERNADDRPGLSFSEEQERRSIMKAAARSSKAHNFVEIEFNPKSSILTDNAKYSLQDVLSEARKDGIINEVIILSWSDEEYPAKNIGRLPRPDRELADRRNLSIQKFVRSMRPVAVNTYNMAEKPNAASAWFNSSDSRMKNSLLAAGLPTSNDSFQYSSKASHSVILVKVE